MIFDSTFWQGRRVFITGHTGFKGSWLSHWLLSMGAELRGMALAPETAGLPEGFSPLFDELALAARMDHVVGDIRNCNAVRESIAEFDPEIVFHLAAQPLVRLSYNQPVETYSTNVMGTVHVLDACRSAPSLKSIVVVTSDKCYENVEQVWPYREIDPMGGHDPYSNSKGCAELVTSAYRNSYFPPGRHGEHGVVLASARAGNVIGGGDWSEDRLLPDAMRSFFSGDALVIRSPDSVRPWQHVLEPLSGYLTLAERGARGETDIARGWNFGPLDEMNLSVRSLIGELGDLLDGGLMADMPTKDRASFHEARLLRLDCSLARARLGWHPKLGMRRMLDMTVAWYKADSAQARSALVDAQIHQYRVSD